MVPKLTTKGIALMIRALNGEGVVFTRIAVGNGEAPADGSDVTGLQNEIVSMGISDLVSEDQYVIIKASMTNADFDQGFDWTEIGVFAQDPDGGEDILYAYGHYVLSGDKAATYIPASSSSLVEINHSVHVFVGELENVTAMLTKHSEFASAADFIAHVENKNNPHGVSKKDVGLELVDNAKAEDQKPVFEESASAYSVDAAGRYTFPNIFSGETVGNILRKVRTLINLVVQHFNAVNPHRLKAEDIGASGKNHKHSMADLVAGTLSVSFGGTGASNAEKARQNLGINSGVWSVIVEAGQGSVIDFEFPQKYSQAPFVVVTPIVEAFEAEGGKVQWSLRNVTDTGVSIYFYPEAHSGWVLFNWIAIPRE